MIKIMFFDRALCISKKFFACYYANFFLDYQEHLDPTIRWTDRLWSTAGTWSGNIFDFFIKVYSKISTGLKIPFKMEGIRRIDDTPVHRAVREALVNCLSNADFGRLDTLTWL